MNKWYILFAVGLIDAEFMLTVILLQATHAGSSVPMITMQALRPTGSINGVPMNCSYVASSNGSYGVSCLPIHVHYPIQKDYWVNGSYNNTGFGADLQTFNDNASYSQSDWIGEFLSGGQFIQLGYYRDGLCSNEPTLFIQYFEWNASTPIVNLGYCGVHNFAIHSYNEFSVNETSSGLWNFYLNGNLIVGLQINATSSGQNELVMANETRGPLFLPLKYKSLYFQRSSAVSQITSLAS